MFIYVHNMYIVCILMYISICICIHITTILNLYTSFTNIFVPSNKSHNHVPPFYRFFFMFSSTNRQNNLQLFSLFPTKKNHPQHYFSTNQPINPGYLKGLQGVQLINTKTLRICTFRLHDALPGVVHDGWRGLDGGCSKTCNCGLVTCWILAQEL